jgi:hypothetical protein
MPSHDQVMAALERIWTTDPALREQFDIWAYPRRWRTPWRRSIALRRKWPRYFGVMRDDAAPKEIFKDQYYSRIYQALMAAELVASPNEKSLAGAHHKRLTGLQTVA